MYTRDFISTVTKVIEDIAEENNQLKLENKELRKKVYQLEATPYQLLFSKMPNYPENGSEQEKTEWYKDWEAVYKALLGKIKEASNTEMD